MTLLCGKVTVTLHYFTLHSLDSELLKMTVGCGMCHINTNMYSTTGVFTLENPRKQSGHT
jgi:hypothetical protein